MNVQKPQLLKAFEEVCSKYSDVVTLKDFINMSEKIDAQGYSFRIKRNLDKIKPVYESAGFMENIKRTIAEKNKQVTGC